MSPSKLALWCLFCSKDLDYWHQIEVEKDKTITHVKKLVTPLLPSDATPNVRVFKPRGRIFNSNRLVNTLGNLTHSELKKQLPCTRKLSSIFNAKMPKDSLHLIIVYDHPVYITCWFRGEQTSQKVVIKIQSNDKVEELKDLIKNKEPQLSHIPHASLQLYLISNTISDLKHDLKEVLETNGSGDLLDGSQTISKVLKGVPFKMFEEQIWVVVEVVPPYAAIHPLSPTMNVQCQPDDVNSGEPIKAEHDMAMLKYSIEMMY